MNRQNQGVSVRRFLSGFAVCVALLGAMPAVAGNEYYPAPAFFLDGLTEHSSWREIRATPGMKAEFPYIDFETTFVPLESVCLDGPMLAIANPRLDTGVRIPADELRAQTQAASARLSDTDWGVQIAAAAPISSTRAEAMRYPVSVYKVIERGLLRQRIFLFEKPWTVLACPTR